MKKITKRRTAKTPALLYTVTDRYYDAEKLLIEIIESRRRILGETHPNTLESINTLIELYEIRGKQEQAEPWREKLQSNITT